MFTGIIEQQGTVVRVAWPDVEIHVPSVAADLREGDSIAVDGVCLTVVSHNNASFVVQVSEETKKRTTLQYLGTSLPTPVNLERPLRATDRLGGHFVLGHVDGVGRILQRTYKDGFAVYRFQVPEELGMYLVPKGSIAVDGISLTIVDPNDIEFSVALIPATLKRTTLGCKCEGSWVNIEADILAKTVHRFWQQAEWPYRSAPAEIKHTQNGE